MNDTHSDIMDTKDSDSTRLYFQNIGGLPHYDNHKLEHLSINVPNTSIDIMSLVEPSLNFRSHNAYSNCKTTIQKK